LTPELWRFIIPNTTKALEACPQEIQDKDILEILSDLNQVPEAQRGAVNFNGGGFDNHRLFWNNMKANGGGEPGGFSSTSAVIQGSGWGWLVFNPSSGKVEYKAMPNQTSPRTEGLIPLLGLDVWEHAYYLKYQNKRPDYVASWWNVVNWDEVEDRFSKAK
jgi:Fe-Mn family superoxide dismutase